MDKYFFCLGKGTVLHSTNSTNSTNTVPQNFLERLLGNKPQIQKTMRNQQNSITHRTMNAISVNDLLHPTVSALVTDRSKYRSQQKPQYARFKASLKYFNKEYPCPMYSYDWNKDYSTGVAISKDNERVGLEKLKLWSLKQLKNETLQRVRIFITLRKDKRTDIRDYDLCILDFNHNMSLDAFLTIPQLKFDVNDKVILHLLEGRSNDK